MPRPAAIIGQITVYAIVAATLGYFSSYPQYARLTSGDAQVLVSFSHVGQRKEDCRKMTRHEIGGMGTNMHRGEIWPRERLPVYVELFLSDQPLFKAMLEPTGIAGDGAAQIYQRFPVPSGWHSIRARLRDSARQEGFDFESQVDVELALGEKFVIDFRSELGGFLFGTHLLDGGRGRAN